MTARPTHYHSTTSTSNGSNDTGSGSTSYFGGFLGSGYMPHVVEAKLSALLSAFENGVHTSPMVRDSSDHAAGVHSGSSTATSTPSTSPWPLARFITPPGDAFSNGFALPAASQSPPTSTQADLPSSTSITVSKRTQQTGSAAVMDECIAELPRSEGKGVPTRRKTWGHFDPSRDPRLLGI